MHDILDDEKKCTILGSSLSPSPLSRSPTGHARAARAGLAVDGPGRRRGTSGNRHDDQRVEGIPAGRRARALGRHDDGEHVPIRRRELLRCGAVGARRRGDGA